MGIFIKNKVEQMTLSAEKVFDELENASGEDATVEDIEGAKALATDWLDQYDHAVQGLNSEERQEFEMELGGVAEEIKAKWVGLKEAPE